MYSILLPSGMVFLLWQRLSLPFRVIGAMAIFTLCMESAGYLFMINGVNNMPLFHLFTYGEATLFALYFYNIYRKRQLKWIFLGMLAAFLLFSGITVIVFEHFYSYNSLQRSVESIWAILLCLVFYTDLFNQSKVANLLHYPHYWMTSGFLLYFAGTLFLNIVGNIVLTSYKLDFDAFHIHAVLNTFLNIIYTIVLWMGSRELTSEQS